MKLSNVSNILIQNAGSWKVIVTESYLSKKAYEIFSILMVYRHITCARCPGEGLIQASYLTLTTTLQYGSITQEKKPTLREVNN